MKRVIRIGIDRDVDRLTRPHVGQLRLLEVCRDPDLIGNEGCDRLPRVDELTLGTGKANDASRLGGGNRRIVQILLRLLGLGLRLLEVCKRTGFLRFGDRFVLQRRCDIRLHLRKARLILRQRRGCLLYGLHATRAVLDQLLLPIGLFLRILKGGIGGILLRSGDIDRSIGGFDLRPCAVDGSPGDIHLTIGLIERDLVVARLDPQDDIAGLEVLVIGHRDICHVARNLGGDGEAARIDEGVIRRLVRIEIDFPDLRVDG